MRIVGAQQTPEPPGWRFFLPPKSASDLKNTLGKGILQNQDGVNLIGDDGISAGLYTFEAEVHDQAGILPPLPLLVCIACIQQITDSLETPETSFILAGPS